jgi:radical SAM superfamily enzyme YgiQ (UPF0313 family)
MTDTETVDAADRKPLDQNSLQLEMDPRASEWPSDGAGRERVLLVALNMPGYYSLPVRILSLVVHETGPLRGRFDARYVEWELDSSLDECLARIAAWQPAIIGFSVNIWNREPVAALMARIKERFPKICLVAGGQEMTGSVVDFLAEIPALDYIVDGEGEIPLRQFLENWNVTEKRLERPDAVSGLRYRDGVEHKLTRPGETVESLDDIPSPILAGLIPLREKNYLGVLLEGTRGCPFRCAFCFEGGRRCKVRTASLDRLHREIEFMAARGAGTFHMMDPILCNSKPERLRGVAEMFREVGRRHKPAYVSVEAYGDQITDEMVESLSDIALIDIGLQSTNPETVRAIHRPFHRQKFIEGIARLRKTNATINLYLISGLPFETITTFLEGIRFALDQQPTRLFLNELCLLNGTELRQRAEEYGYEFDARPPYLARRSRWISAHEMAVIQSFSRVVTRRHNLCAKSVAFGLPWTAPRSEGTATQPIRVVLGGPCAWRCPGCRLGEGATAKADDGAIAEQIKQCGGRDVVLVAGDGYPMRDLLRLAAQFQFVGASRIKLAAPLTLIPDQATVQSLLNCGVWHFPTFVDLRGMPRNEEEIPGDPSFRRAVETLRWLNLTYRLKQRAEIWPFAEIVVLTQARDFREVRNVLRLLGQQCSAVDLPGLATAESVAWIREDERRFREVVTGRFWIRFTEAALRRLLFDTADLDKVIGHLRTLDLLSCGAERPPCYEPQ